MIGVNYQIKASNKEERNLFETQKKKTGKNDPSLSP